MKRYLFALAVLVLCTGIGGTAVAAPANATVDVTATVIATCLASVGPNGAIDFGDIDLSAPAAGAVVNPNVRCTNGHTASVEIESAGVGGGPVACGVGMTGRLTGPAAYTMDYTFDCPATVVGAGLGAVSEVPITIGNASLDPAAYQDAPVCAGGAGSGCYTDTLTITVTP